VQFTQSVPSPTGQGAVTSIGDHQGEGEIMGLELDLLAAITEAADVVGDLRLHRTPRSPRVATTSSTR